MLSDAWAHIILFLVDWQALLRAWIITERRSDARMKHDISRYWKSLDNKKGILQTILAEKWAWRFVIFIISKESVLITAPVHCTYTGLRMWLIWNICRVISFQPLISLPARTQTRYTSSYIYAWVYSMQAKYGIHSLPTKLHTKLIQRVWNHCLEERYGLACRPKWSSHSTCRHQLLKNVVQIRKTKVWSNLVRHLLQGIFSRSSISAMPTESIWSRIN